MTPILLLLLGGLWWTQAQLVSVSLGFLNPFFILNKKDEPVNVERTMTRMGVPRLAAIKDYAWYAGAAYCPLPRIKDWDCSFCQRTRNTAKFLAYLNNEEYGTWGFIAADDVERKVVVSFRGTDNQINRMTNLKIYTTEFTYAPVPDIMVHQGFLESMESLSGHFMYSLRKIMAYRKYRDYNLVLVGHSLGGAMASLAAVKIKRELNLNWSRIQIFTYGQPRTGNLKFAHWYNAQRVTVARVVNYADSIPHLLGGSLGYFAHHQNEIFITPSPTGGPPRVRKCANDVLEDPQCSNSLPVNDYSSDYHSTYFDANFKDPC